MVAQSTTPDRPGQPCLWPLRAYRHRQSHKSQHYPPVETACGTADAGRPSAKRRTSWLAEQIARCPDAGCSRVSQASGPARVDPLMRARGCSRRARSDPVRLSANQADGHRVMSRLSAAEDATTPQQPTGQNRSAAPSQRESGSRSNERRKSIAADESQKRAGVAAFFCSASRGSHQRSVELKTPFGRRQPP